MSRCLKNPVWIYVENDHSFRELEHDDARLDWNWPHAPPNQVRFKPRTNSDRTMYVPFGKTREEAAASANQYTLADIAKLEAQIVQLRTRLVKP